MKFSVNVIGILSHIQIVLFFGAFFSTRCNVYDYYAIQTYRHLNPNIKLFEKNSNFHIIQCYLTETILGKQ